MINLNELEKNYPKIYEKYINYSIDNENKNIESSDMFLCFLISDKLFEDVFIGIDPEANVEEITLNDLTYILKEKEKNLQ